MTLLFTLIMLCCCVPGISPAHENVTDEPIPQAGVNIISVGNQYADPIFQLGEVDRFMHKLAESGLQRISVRVSWKAMEPEPGQYNQVKIANLRRVIESAQRNGLKVMLDFHTKFNTGSFTFPPWITQYQAQQGKPTVPSLIMLVRNADVGRAYLAMQRHVLTQLSDIQSLDTISLMNEPWVPWDHGPEGIGEDTQAICDLLVESGKVVHEVNVKWKRAIRFTISNNPWSDHENKRFNQDKVFTAADIIGLNIYLDPTGTIDNEGADGRLREGGSWTVYRKAVQEVREAGKELWVTEFGMSAGGVDGKGVVNSQERQRQYYQGICARWWDGEHRPHAVLPWVIEPNQKSRQNFDIWDSGKFDWNPAGQIYVKYAQRNRNAANQR